MVIENFGYILATCDSHGRLWSIGQQPRLFPALRFPLGPYPSIRTHSKLDIPKAN